MPRPYLAVLFDYDFTLGDSSVGIINCVNSALEHMGLPTAPEDAIRRTVGLALPACFAALTGDNSPERAARFVALFTQRADEVMLDHTFTYPGVRRALAEVAAAGVRLGLVSTKFHRRLEQVTTRDGLRQLFGVLVGGDDVPAPKPDPAGVLQAAATLGVAPERCLFVGDSAVDGETARRAGTDFAAVLTGATPAAALAAYDPVAVMATVGEVADVVLRPAAR